MTTEELAKLIAERVIELDRLNTSIDCDKDFIDFVHHGYIRAYVAQAICDLNLVQAEPIPAGAVPVVVYVGLVKGSSTAACAFACDSRRSEEDAAEDAFAGCDTHRVRLEGYALPVGVPTLKAISNEVK